MNIIGLSAFYHDSACCLIRDGNLVCAVEEERLSRRKHDSTLPWRAFRYCLDEGGISLADVDCVAYYESPIKKLSRQIWMSLQSKDDSPTHDQVLRHLDIAQVERVIRQRLGFDGRIEVVNHHLSHAASSFYFSGFSDAAILTVDAVGEWATTSYGHGSGGDIDIFEEVEFPNSLGMLYAALTAYLGFEVNDGEYKVMGLAPYGQPRFVSALRRLLNFTHDGQFELDMKYFDFVERGQMFSEDMVRLIGIDPRQPESELRECDKDLARSVQQVLEEALMRMVAYLHSRVPSANLCMAGGVALNCVANARILREGPFPNLFVQPAASDAGACLGAAAISYRRLSGKSLPLRRLPDVFLGPSYPSSEIRRLLKSCSVNAQDFGGRLEEMIEYVAGLLAKGQVIGWFQGKMEFGPRALGRRSILADPRSPKMRDRINVAVKKRETFRPFAPAALEGKAHEHFEISHPAPFMLETVRVLSKIEMPAVTHIDGSARLQTVSADTNPRFAELLARFESKTGCPVLLNTSFNVRGQPIVCSPYDAIMCFVESEIDVLVLEDLLLERKDIPDLWRLACKGLTASKGRERANVYTLF